MKVHFLTRKSVVDKEGMSPVLMSININGERKYIATGKKRNAKRKMSAELNDYCEELYAKCQRIEVTLMRMGVPVTMTNFMKMYKEGTVAHTVTSVYDEVIKLKDERARGHQIKYSQVDMFTVGRGHFAAFGGENMDLMTLTPSTVERYSLYLHERMKHNSALNYLKQLKFVLKYAVQERYIQTSPFLLTLSKDKSDVEALTEDEVRKIADKGIQIQRLAKVRDCFLLQCYTALSYSDMRTLTRDDVVDGMIVKARTKTGEMAYAPLLPEAVALLEKYDYKMPVLANQRYNAYLKEIADICAIAKNLHSHLARHTCATILLNRGVSMDIVAKVLGHSNSKVTAAVYAKMLPETVKSAVLTAMSSSAPSARGE